MPSCGPDHPPLCCLVVLVLNPKSKKFGGVGVRLPLGCVYINLINIYRVKPSTAVVGSLATTTFVDTLSPGRTIAPHAQRRWHCAARPPIAFGWLSTPLEPLRVDFLWLEMV